MHILAIIIGAAIILLVLMDAFETVVLPRRVQRHFRITILFYRNTWAPYAKLASHIKSQTRRETVLGYFGPISMIALLVIWALGLIFGFALLQYGGGEHLAFGNQPITFGLLLYHSGETFFTLGYGDITPASYYSRALSVLEAGTGFGFLAVVTGTSLAGLSRSADMQFLIGRRWYIHITNRMHHKGSRQKISHTFVHNAQRSD